MMNGLAKQLGQASLVLLAFILLFSVTVNSQQRTQQRISSRQAQQHYQKGLELLKKGDLDGSVEAFKKAILLRPNEAEAHYYLGYALGIKGQLADAIVGDTGLTDRIGRHPRRFLHLTANLGDRGGKLFGR